MTALYKIENLHYGYKWNKTVIPVIKGASLEVPVSSFACLVGPSGMGKTTLLNLMGLLDKPQQGKLELAGKNTGVLSETELEKVRLHDLGFIFQAFYLIPTLTVLENTTYFLPMLGVSASEAEERAHKVLEALKIGNLKQKFPLELSGGQRQRVAIARALAKKPKVILADEPTANLDHATAEETINIFKNLHEADNVSFVFSTHDLNLVSYAKQVFKINDGQIQ